MFDENQNEMLRELTSEMLDGAAKAAEKGLLGGVSTVVAGWLAVTVRWASPTFIVGSALTVLIFLVLWKLGMIDPAQAKNALKGVVQR